MAEKLIPVVKADEEEEEELVDPQQALRDECSQKQEAQSFWTKYQECNNRVNSKSNTAETCEEELIDYVHALDKCVNKDLFKRLK
ncbi:cytochrome b-c1 complex subunit 6, mitochondrial [Danaus plexippus]|uniref:Cytochrome b-c1 complex subunit 6 n=1 Tax=Danaus plexippus plexippus TaxID=278856 RepID=A0A212FMK8_DANPL|nr:cytochrome b-c1 complex subunit 6, mitochondrial [Danaus plexippus]OWR54963.1 ubiquinol-cytochrome C reductase complex protein [Danaus plexippus plexippus]